MLLTSFCGDHQLSQLQDPYELGVSLPPTGLIANDLSQVTFLVLFMVEGECEVESVEGGGGWELGGVAIFLLRKNINFKNDHKTILCYVNK